MCTQETPIHGACQGGNYVSIIKMLLVDNRININARRADNVCKTTQVIIFYNIVHRVLRSTRYAAKDTLRCSKCFLTILTVMLQSLLIIM